MSRFIGQDVAKVLDKVSLGEREAVARQVVSEYTSKALTPEDRELAYSIFYVLSEDIEVKVRAALAESLKNSEDIPHDLARKLALDVADVSLPIIEFSVVLTDKDLAHIVTTRSSTEQKAIARRKKVSPTISEVLVKYGDAEVVQTLVENTEAEIEDEALGIIYNNFSHVEPVSTGLVHRKTLPVDIAERLVAIVSDELRMYLVSTHKVRESVLEDVVLQGRETAVTDLLEKSTQPDRDVAALVAQMEIRDRLTPTIVLKSLEITDLEFFEHSLAIRADIPVENVRALLGDKGDKL